MLSGVSTSADSVPTSTSPPPQQTSAAATPAAAADLSDDGVGGGRNSGGNRWPRQETLYLLKIRSDMDAAFRDSSLKAPLWDEVSRKLAALGFNRSAKKCKEKFENVYKYHKRIKEGRSSKADGKTYKFFEQLQALEGSPSAGGGGNHQPPLALPPPSAVAVVSKQPPMSSVVIPTGGSELQQNNNVDPISVAAPAVGVAMPAAINMNVNQAGGFRFSQLNVSALDLSSGSGSSSSDDEPVEKRRNRKRKWKEFFGKLMKEVVEKQEELQSKFIDALERRERDRMAREEAWRLQEMAKMKREHELLVQERSMVAAKDAAVITFLQKITEQNPNAVIPQMPAMLLLQQQQQLQPAPAPTPAPPQPTPPMQQQPQPQPQPQQPEPQQQTPPAVPAPVSASISVPIPAPVPPRPAVRNLEIATGENILQPSPSRWPKAEINALIQIRTSLDTKYQENGPKGPLWEEVSGAMRNLGYNRNAKRCKEKWENINKYYKKVKESSKKRPEDSKTCPYFHQLDAIYREKAAASGGSSNNNNNSNSNPGLAIKPETQMAPIMARPEQQWPLPAVVQQQQQQQQYQQKLQQQQENADLNEDDYDDEDDDEEDEDEEGGEYEVVPNKTSSMASTE